jgi:hypothetical protein
MDHLSKYNMTLRLFSLILPLVFSFGIYAEEIPNEQKAKIVEGIYKKLYSALGTNDIAPIFEFNTTRARQIAYMSSDRDGNPLIGFESKAFDVCAKLGDRRDDAIAFLLGHEISHHTMKHHWGDEFRTAYSIGGLEAEMRDIDKASAKKYEAQADERGGILCYMAGFTTKGIGEQLLRELYTAYELKDSDNYPTLEERIQIAKTQDSLVQNYIKVFETANYALLIEEYKLAIDCYEVILSNDFKSREIFNNMGVAYFLQGVKLADKDDLKYVFPVELDLESKLQDRGTKGMGDDVRALFIEAQKYFEAAIGFDKSYASAYLNLASTYAVLKDFRKARFNVEEVSYIANAKNDAVTLNNAQMLKAIIEDLDPQGDKKAAKKIFEELDKKGHALAQVNFAIFEGEDLSDVNFPKVPIDWMNTDNKEDKRQAFPQPEKLDGLSDYRLSSLVLDIPEDREQQLTIGRFRKLTIGNLDHSRVLVTTDNDGKYLLFHSTYPSYSGALKQGIKLGNSLDQLLKAYGSPNAIVTTRQGMVLSYPGERMFVMVDNSNTIKQFVCWKRNLD